MRRLLAIANLRIGEQANCLGQHTPESCVFPIRGSGVHRDPTGSRRAIALLSAELRQRPNHLESRWLLNLAYMTVGDYPAGVPARWRIPPATFASDAEISPFPDVAIQAGADLAGLAGGGSVEDFDGDGHLDLVASSWGPRDSIAYLRNRGDGTFEDRSRAAGLEGETGGLNLSHADYDNDGHPDLLVLRGGWLGARALFPNSLLRNRGDGSFEDVTLQAGIGDPAPGQTAAWADYDADGWLDLFVGNETTSAADPHPCRLWRNLGDGRFADVAPQLGLAALGFVKGVVWGDYDNDGRPDLYVSRMGQPNLLFHNDGPTSDAPGGWQFAERAAEAGVAEPRRSFPTWFFDYDNDGWLDLFVAAWDGSTAGQVAARYLGMPTQSETPRLYRNTRDGRFEDVTTQLGLDRVLLAMGANFGDLDNDGWLDVYVGTGAPDLATLMPNRMFRNDRSRRFEDVTSAGGFGHVQKGHAIAFGDVDGDGDQDIYSVLGGWYTGDVAKNALFSNPGHGNHWLTLRLRGRRTNRLAVGVRVRIDVDTADGPREIHRVVGTGGSFGASSLQLETGLGKAQAIRAVSVTWPTTGQTQRFDSVPLDAVLEIHEDEGLVSSPLLTSERERE